MVHGSFVGIVARHTALRTSLIIPLLVCETGRKKAALLYFPRYMLFEEAHMTQAGYSLVSILP